MNTTCECGHIHDEPEADSFVVCPGCDHNEACTVAPGEARGCDSEEVGR